MRSESGRTRLKPIDGEAHQRVVVELLVDEVVPLEARTDVLLRADQRGAQVERSGCGRHVRQAGGGQLAHHHGTLHRVTGEIHGLDALAAELRHVAILEKYETLGDG